MNIERRGKYPGVKVHLDEKETREVLDVLFKVMVTAPTQRAFKIVAKMAKLIDLELTKDPSLLDPRTPEEIRAELITERDKAIEKLSRLDAGIVWNAGKDKS